MYEDDLDASLLMWDIRHNIKTDALSAQRTVIYFDFPDAKRGMKRWWLVIEDGEVDLCLEDPGHDVDLALFTQLKWFTQIWMGDLTLGQARSSGKLRLEGQGRLKQTMHQWLGFSSFATIEAAAERSANVRAPERRST